MGLSALFITAFFIGFSGALIPGPLLTVNISESYHRGVKSGPLLILGHGILEVVLVIGLTLGLGALLVRPLFQSCIALAGGVILLWMGWSMARDAYKGGKILEFGAQGGNRGMPLLLAGVIVSAFNPYWLLWWATIGLTYVTLAMQKGMAGLTVFLSGHLLADFLWYTAVSLAVVSGKRFISEKGYRILLVVCGAFLLGTALYFIWSGRNFFILIAG